MNLAKEKYIDKYELEDDQFLKSVLDENLHLLEQLDTFELKFKRQENEILKLRTQNERSTELIKTLKDNILNLKGKNKERVFTWKKKKFSFFLKK